jgi:hypothetical protein
MGFYYPTENTHWSQCFFANFDIEIGNFFDILVQILLLKKKIRWISPNFKYQKNEKKILKTLIEGSK